ncbi:MAG TPA: 50S ribosomal protein L18 [Acidimicrobiaceae bacterium]|nr:50S ribosomal protein L18 [Acidimicrobiaceae bacterium]HAQ24310.1 50S ribosomal protein L18 [Acidimicrobiaceae bacterium]HCV35131.1 50S ribosomal protein L18 [Acidimicrobiaceae bacterium]
MSTVDRSKARRRRHRRVRKSVTGTEARPRLAVFRSAKHISAQIIDDQLGRTVVAASTEQSGVADGVTGIAAATEVGRVVAERAREAGIATVVFDRGGYKYHGRVAALADAARDAGLEF